MCVFSSTCTSVQCAYVYVYFHSHLPSFLRACTGPRCHHTLVLPTLSSWYWFCSFSSCSPSLALGRRTQEVSPRPLQHQPLVLAKARGKVWQRPTTTKMRSHLNSFSAWSTTLPLHKGCNSLPCWTIGSNKGLRRRNFARAGFRTLSVSIKSKPTALLYRRKTNG